MLATPSGSGKDIGGLFERGAQQLNWYIGSSGSADAYLKRPNGLLCISEIQHWLDERRCQHNATEFLVFAFNKGYFTQCVSKRTRNPQERSALYGDPNHMVHVQPDVFKSIVEVHNNP